MFTSLESRKHHFHRRLKKLLSAIIEVTINANHLTPQIRAEKQTGANLLGFFVDILAWVEKKNNLLIVSERANELDIRLKAYEAKTEGLFKTGLKEFHTTTWKHQMEQHESLVRNLSKTRSYLFLLDTYVYEHYFTVKRLHYHCQNFDGRCRSFLGKEGILVLLYYGYSSSMAGIFRNRWCTFGSIFLVEKVFMYKFDLGSYNKLEVRSESLWRFLYIRESQTLD
ncbi:hypothetical protein FF38_09584 [Lucilia cuprina]|uniref:Uncharacterized protein n=1 Tax=Lucilia cuprina TaxID=7375 RepID=A0A0L0C4H9_LUCCU|nr:hypothetical protein FF38_09584 [Lucilia cuprina]